MPEPDLLISIVIAAYNAERFLAETLASVQRQTETRWEVIVVDDGSIDRTAEVVSEFVLADGRFQLLRQDHAGLSAARNAGFRHTNPSSEYITFLDSDDLWLPEALASLLRRIERNPTAIGSHGLADFIDEHGTRFDVGVHPAQLRYRLVCRHGRLIRLGPDAPTDFEVLVNGYVMFPPGLLLARRRAYEFAGPFDPTLVGGEDIDMTIRLSRSGPIEFIDEVILYYRRHADSLSVNQSGEWATWFVRCKAFHSRENTLEQRRLARRGWRAYQRSMAAEAWDDARAGARRQQMAPALRSLARVGVSIVRFLRGFPTPRVSSEPLSWPA
jgi:glycosyltransferase involved in cell wall biosynthesis